MPSSKKRCKDHERTSCDPCKKPLRKFPVRSRKCSKKNSEKNLVREVAEAAALDLFYAERLWCHAKNSKEKTQSCISCIVVFSAFFLWLWFIFCGFHIPYLGYHQGARTRNRPRPDPPRYPSKGSPKPLSAECRAAPWKCTLNVHQMRVVHRIFANVVWISCLLLIWCVFLRSLRLRMCAI